MYAVHGGWKMEVSEKITIERFWHYVEITPSCWLWTAAITDGYGSIHSSYLRRNLRAHRFAYELLVGPIPVGLQLDHLCRVRRCVNPAHLEPVTARENIMRGVGMGARNARRTHCPKGHPYEGDNLLLDKTGRRCRTCIKDYFRRTAQDRYVKWKQTQKKRGRGGVGGDGWKANS